jgi:hypothetical protein
LSFVITFFVSRTPIVPFIQNFIQFCTMWPLGTSPLGHSPRHPTQFPPPPSAAVAPEGRSRAHSKPQGPVLNPEVVVVPLIRPGQPRHYTLPGRADQEQLQLPTCRRSMTGPSVPQIWVKNYHIVTLLHLPSLNHERHTTMEVGLPCEHDSISPAHLSQYSITKVRSVAEAAIVHLSIPSNARSSDHGIKWKRCTKASAWLSISHPHDDIWAMAVLESLTS